MNDERQNERDDQRKRSRDESARVRDIDVRFPEHLRGGDCVKCLRQDVNALYAYCELLASQLRTAGITNIAPPPWPSVDTERID